MPFTGAGTGIQNADDVFFSSLADGDTLQYDLATAKWNNGAPAVGAPNIVAQSTAYVASNGDFVIADASSAGFTVTLPAAAAGAKVSVKKVDSSVNSVDVAPPSGTIDDVATVSIDTQWQSQDFFSDGSTWYRI